METLASPSSSSPGISPVSLSDCIEELLKFLFSASSNETLDIDLGLSKVFCSSLLNPEPSDCGEPDAAVAVSGGFPAHPLYKHLSSALYSCITSGTFVKTCHTNVPIQEDESLKKKEIEWSKLIASEGAGLVKLAKKQLKGGVPLVTTFGVQVYRKFYTEEKEKSNGVLAIHVLRAAVQPYISVANIIHGLGYNGIGSLLGLMHTEGTIPDALPPLRSVLMSSFMIPYHSDVKSSTLTFGARALAKHVHRSKNGWWGNFAGNDSDKNRLALNVINHLIAHCCWMNIYQIQPHNCVFEIRVGEGYGARWSRDGSKFIGFLEPYMEDGHLKG